MPKTIDQLRTQVITLASEYQKGKGSTSTPSLSTQSNQFLNGEKALFKVINDTPTEELLDVLLNVAHEEPSSYVRSLFVGCKEESPKGKDLRFKLILRLADLLDDGEIIGKESQECVSIMTSEIDYLIPAEISELINKIIAHLNDRSRRQRQTSQTEGKSIELLPKCLEMIEAKVGEKMSKNFSVKSQHISNLCECYWMPSLVTRMVTIFREISLEPSDFKKVVSKALMQIPSLPLQELPPLIYQLLLLSMKGPKTLIIAGILESFAILEKKCSSASEENGSKGKGKKAESSFSLEQLRDVQGTIILHIGLSVRQDQELGKEFIKALKSSRVPTTFSIGLLLGLYSVQRLESSVQDIFKGMIIDSFETKAKFSSTIWVKRIFRSCGVVTDEISLNEALQTSIIDAAKYSCGGWGQITQQSVQLGVFLLDLHSPRLTESDQKAVFQLGLAVLGHAFENHESVREKILDEIVQRVSKPEITHNYFLLLSQIVSLSHQHLGNHVVKIKELIDHLPNFTPQLVKMLIGGIYPLIRNHSSTQSHLLIVLKKTIFSNNETARIASVCGCLHLLKCIASSEENKSDDENENPTSSSTAPTLKKIADPQLNNLSFEILGTLRRCLSQQASVREHLYDGLAELLEINFGLVTPVFELLSPHLDRYCEGNPASTPPIHIDRCIEKNKEIKDEKETGIKLTEPIHKLINCVQRCVSLYAKEKTPLPALRSMRDRMEKLAKRMSDCDLEDFDLHKQTEFGGSEDGNYHTLFATLLSGVYETLIEFKASRADSGSSAETTIKLFEKYKELKDLVKGVKEKGSGAKKKPSGSKKKTDKADKKDKGKGKKKASDDEGGSEHEEKEKKTKRGQKKNSAGIKIKPVHISTKGMRNIVKIALQEREEDEDVWRKCKGFIQFILEKCRDQLHQFSILEKERQFVVNDFDNQITSPLIYKHCMHLAPYLLTEFLRIPTSSEAEEIMKLKKSNRPTLNSISLECFELVIKHGINCCQVNGKIDIQQVAEFLKMCNLNKDEEEEDDALTLISNRITEFESMIDRLVEENSQSEIEILISIISHLINIAFPFGFEVGSHLKWIRKMCEEMQNPSATLGKKLVTLHLKLEHLILKDMKNIFHADLEYSADIHTYVGKSADINEESQIMSPHDQKFSIFKENTIHGIIDVVLNVQDNAIEEAQWILTSIEKELAGKLDTEFNNDNEEDENAKVYSSEVREQLYSLLDKIVDMMETLCESKITGPPSIHMCKTLYGLYATLSNVTKFCNSQKVPPSPEFRELIDHSATLKDTLSQFLHVITSTEAPPDEEEEEEDENGKKKKKKKKPVITTAKIAKESSTIPQLIYAIEAFEGILIKYGKQHKTTLTKKFKRLVNRDFKFKEEEIKRKIKEGDEEEEEEEEQEEEEEEEEEESKKRKKPTASKKGESSSSSSAKKKKV